MEVIQLLLVEDNEGDILLTQEALEEAKIITELCIARDGEEAIKVLSQEGDYAATKLPDLILLDINLPKKSGHEVLKYIKGSEKLKHIPVIMLSTSSFKKDINLAYANYVNCFITKPIDMKGFIDVIATIENFWISIVKLPGKKQSDQ